MTRAAERVLMACAVVYPLAGTFVKKWYGGLYVLAALCALFVVISSGGRSMEKHPLDTREKLLIAGPLACFASYLLSTAANGMMVRSLAGLETELRFAFFPFLYLALRNLRHLSGRHPVEWWRWTLPAGALICGSAGLAEYIRKYAAGEPGFRGITGAHFHLFVGPVFALLCLMCLHRLMMLEPDAGAFERRLYWGGCAAAAASAVYSLARTALLVLAAGFLFLLARGMYRRESKFSVSPLVITAWICVLAAMFTPDVGMRLEALVSQGKDYIDEGGVRGSNYTVGLRCELAKAGLEVFSTSPVVGCGHHGIQLALMRMYPDGLPPDGPLDRSVFTAKHTRDVATTVLACRGAAGMAALALMLGFPLYLSFLPLSSLQCGWGGLVSVVWLVAGITEPACILRNNYVSLFLFFNAVIWSSVLSSPSAEAERPSG